MAIFYHEEDLCTDEDNEGGANMPIDWITGDMFLSVAELGNLPCYEEEEDQETDIMQVLPLLLEWLERILPSSCYQGPAQS